MRAAQAELYESTVLRKPPQTSPNIRIAMNTPHRILTGSISTLLRKAPLVLAAASLGFAASAAAQTITWGAATTMSADADVLTTGAYDRAYIFGSTGAVNGVSFTSFQANTNGDSTGAGMVNYPGPAYAPNGSDFPNYANLTAAYQDIARFGVYADGVNGSLTLGSLNTGLDYTLQLWVNDSREFGGNPISGRTETITAGNVSPSLDYNVQNGTGGVGQFVTGTFTGSGASTTLTFAANASAQVNALNLRATGVGAGNTATITAPKNWTTLSTGAGSTLDYNLSSNFTASTAITGSGTLQKSGASTLTLAGASAYSGGTNITGGTLRLAGAPAASLWLDAAKTSSISTSGSAVAQWNDAAGGANYVSQGNGAARPNLTTDNAFAGPSKAMVDFGANMNSGQTVNFNSTIADIRSVFWVMKGGGFMLGHTGAYDFHRGEPGHGVNPTDNIWESANGWTHANIRNGQTYVNGTQVDGTTTGLSGSYQMIDVITTGNVQANALANDRNIPGRIGGQQIGEVIIFNTALSTTERQQVETYLNYKWFGTGAGVGNLLPVTTAVTLSGGGTLDLSGVNYQTVASLASADASSRVTLGGAAFTVGDANDTTFAGVISDTGTLTKVGAGKLSLTGANTFTGLTTISNGTLELTGSAGALGTGAVTNNAALRLNRGSALAIVGAIGGSGTLTQAGAGTSTLSGANTYTGATSITNGRLQLNGAAAGTLTTSGITANTGGTLGFTTGAASTLTLPSAGITLGGGTVAFDLGGAGVNDAISTNSFTLTANSAFTFTAIGVPATGSTYTLVSSTNAIVTGGFTLAGQTIGKLTLTPVVNANTITLTPTLSQGIWNIATGGNWSLGNPSATGGNWLNYKPTVAGDAALFGSIITSARTVVVDTPHSVGFITFDNASAYTIGTAGSSNLTLDNGGPDSLLRVLSGAHTIAENVALTGNAVVVPAAGGMLTVTGNFTGSGSVTHAGPGPLLLTGANTHSGGTVLLGGFLTLGGASGTATGTGDLTVAIASGWPNSGSVELASNQTVGVVHFTGADYGAVHTQGYNLTTAGLDSTGGTGVVENRAANQPDPAGNATVFINVAAATTYSFDGYLRDGYDPTATTLAVVKNGPGTQVLTGNNISYTGGTTINAGILRPGSDTALGAAGGSIAVNSGGSLDINGRKLDGYTQNISIAGAGAVASLGALGNASATANLNAIRGITLTANASIGGDGARWDIGRLDFNADPNITVDHITGGGFVLTKVGSSYLALLTGASNLAGFVINGGTVAPHENTSFGAGPVTLNSGIIQPWAGLNVPNALILNGGVIENQGFGDSYNGPITINNPATVTGGNATITFAGNMSGSGDLMKTGGVRFNVSGNNTQTGTLTIAGGNVGFSSATGNATQGNVLMTGPGSFLLMGAPNQFGPNSGLHFNAPGHAEFALYGNNQTIASLSSANNLAVVQNSHVGIGPATASSTLTINQNTDTTYTGYIRDNTANDAFTISIIKSGIGSLTLGGGDVSYTGSTAVNGGKLVLFNTGNFQSPTTVASGATLTWSGTGGYVISSAATVALASGATLEDRNPTAFVVLNGAVTTSGATTINLTSNATGAAGEGFYLDGGLHGTGTVTISAANAGSGVNFRNNNSTFSGSLIVNGIASTTPFAGSGLGVGGATSALQNADITLNGTMELLNGGMGWANTAVGTFGMGALSGTGVMVANYTLTGGVTTVTLGNTNNNGTFSGVIADGAGNTLNLVKTGVGTQTLSGTNTYTGSTTVNAGTLVFLASQTLSSLDIAAGAEVVFGDGMAFAPGTGGKFGGPVLVPEPGTLGLLLIGALGMAARRRRSA